MAKNRRYSPPSKQKRRPYSAPRSEAPVEAAPPPEKKAPVVYGAAFVVLEAQDKSTYVFASGAWTSYEMSIAECRQEGQVKQLPQKVNGRTRYEVRMPRELA